MKRHALTSGFLPTVLLSTLAAATLHAQPPVVPGGTKLKTTEQQISGLAARPADSAAASGEIQVVVQLTKPPVAGRQADMVANNAPMSGDTQRSYIRELEADQAALTSELSRLGARRDANLTKALNAVVVTVDAKQIPAISALPGVKSVRRVRDYEMHLEQTVPYIGAAAAQSSGFTGAGVRVAVLDSGIDYTHFNFGGPGTIEAYQAAYGVNAADPKNKVTDNLFPTAKVIGGFDFVGEVWPNGPTVDDPDPIGEFNAHGTHVGDIIAGASADGTHKGVAPGASLYSFKVCSAVSTSCNGVAILRGFDAALDPNFDGDISDRADIINLSLGAPYGQREDDSYNAASNASRVGVTVVVSAGNSSDRPYIVGSPSTAQEAISVANTTMPDAKVFALVINSGSTPNGSIAGTYTNTNSVSWAPVVGTTTADMIYVGRGCPAGHTVGNEPEDALPSGVTPDQIAGKIALIDRGACAASQKVDRFADLGAVGAVIANNVAGNPPSFSFGGPPPPQGQTFKPVPTLVIQNTLGFGASTPLRQALANGPVNATISENNFTSTAGSLISSSSRGPDMSFNSIKPEIGAPGNSVSAVAGGGTAENSFSGTSGAAPMVAGSAALLKEGFFDASPITVKSLLMNNALRDIFINQATQPGVLAPITRIGAGQVRVDKALNANAIAFVPGPPDQPSLSFGFHRVNVNRTLTKTVRVRNFLSQSRTFNISNSFRYTNDANSGAVTISTPSTITVPGRRSADFVVTLTMNAASLPSWTLNGGQRGGDGFRLQEHEFDGFIHINEGSDELSLPWHILPHKAAATRAAASSVTLNNGAGSVPVNNTTGAIAGVTDVFHLIGTSPRVDITTLPKQGDNFAVVDVQNFGVREVNLGTAQAPVMGLQFLITTYDPRAHPLYPGGFEVDIDTNGDGTTDFFVYQQELTGFGATGQSVIVVQKVGSTTGSIQRFNDADLNSTNVIYSVAYSQLELPNASRVTPLNIDLYGYDNYFTGNTTDAIENITFTPGVPKYNVSPFPQFTVPVGGSTTLNISANEPGAAASPSQTGVLLGFRDARAKLESQAIRVSP
jgi:minor extracellular serine protease Vpr